MDAENVYPVFITNNEWDPSEEIVVDFIEGAMVPPWDVMTKAVEYHEHLLNFFQQ